MAVESCKAIVLKAMEFKDSSYIATLLTAESGRVDCIAKGCRRPKSRFASSIQPLNLIDTVYHQRSSRSLQTLAEAQLVREFRKIKNDTERFAYASYCAQLIGSLVQVDEPSADMFNLLLRALDEIDSLRGDIRLLSAAVALRAVRTAGFGLQLGLCVRCGKPLGAEPFLDFAAGGTACGSCGGDGPTVTADEIALLDKLAKSSAVTVMQMDVEKAAACRLLSLVNRYVTTVIERDLSSWRFIESLASTAHRAAQLS